VTQASKYSVKASRLKVAMDVFEFFKIKLPQVGTLGDFRQIIEQGLCHLEFVKFIKLMTKSGQEEEYFEVCDRKIQLNTKVGTAINMIKLIVDNYGHRAYQATVAGGADLKALYHSVRIAYEAEEFLLTGHITQPRPERELLLKIRNGLMPFQEISELIETQLAKVKEAISKSALPDEPDYEYAKDFVLRHYSDAVLMRNRLDHIKHSLEVRSDIAHDLEE